MLADRLVVDAMRRLATDRKPERRKYHAVERLGFAQVTDAQIEVVEQSLGHSICLPTFIMSPGGRRPAVVSASWVVPHPHRCVPSA